MPEAKEALSLTAGSALITPRQLGPIIRIDYLWAIEKTWRSSSARSGPTSLKPAEIMTSPFTPFFPDSSTTLGPTGAGTITTARSTHLGGSRTDGTALAPLIECSLGLAE